MKIMIVCLALTGCLAFAACNNGAKENTDLQAKADSLQDQVINDHDIAMPGWHKIPDLQQKAQVLLDSIAKLPAKAQDAAAPLKAKLENLVNELGEAKKGMDDWMEKLNLDSAKDNLAKRIEYFADEKVKIGKVKEDISNGLAKADSLLKAKL